MILLLKNLLFVLVVPGTVAVAAPMLMARAHAAQTGAAAVVALGCFALGSGAALWCAWDFAAFGRGTPAPIDPPKKLVTRGPYRVVRNPMYVGVLLVLAGWATLYRSATLAVYAIAAWTGFHLWTVLYEEPHLRRVFGAEYDDYASRVGRWLPRFRRRPPA